MKSPFKLISKSNNWFYTVTKNFKKGFCCRAGIKMTDEKADGDIEPPNKKLCIQEKNEAEPKVRYKKTALLLGYFGDDYFGMQINTIYRTIEGELLSALYKAGYILASGVKEPVTIKFQRTTRTDRGVSAAKQVVSLQMAENYCLENVNKFLPKDIRIFSAKKVTRGFNCKNECTARTYSYTLPTFALAPELHKQYPEKYRINKETLEKVNDILLSYIGTHNFHNFTVKRKFADPSVKRFIKSVKAEEPFLENEEEFISLKIRGQSFMFHQIRKMIGHMIAVLKGIAPDNIQTEIWTDKRFSVPLAPGAGLVLEDVHFDRYNKKFGDDGIHEPLEWDSVAEEVNNFRSFILSQIIKKELESKSMYNWILDLSCHTYDFTSRINYDERKIDEKNIPLEEDEQIE